MAGVLEAGPAPCSPGAAPWSRPAGRDRAGPRRRPSPRAGSGGGHAGPAAVAAAATIRATNPRTTGVPAAHHGARAPSTPCTWARSDREAMMILDQRRRSSAWSPRGCCARELVAGALDQAPAASREVLAGRERRCARAATRSTFLPRVPAPRAAHAPDADPASRARGRRRTDAEFRLPDGRLLIVEIDGIGHLDVTRGTRTSPATTSSPLSDRRADPAGDRVGGPERPRPVLRASCATVLGTSVVDSVDWIDRIDYQRSACASGDPSRARAALVWSGTTAAGVLVPCALTGARRGWRHRCRRS